MNKERVLDVEKLVYESRWILETIYNISDRIRSRLTDQTLFEERSIKRVGEYLAVNEDNRRNKRYIISLIEEVASAVLERNKNEHSDLFTDLAVRDESSGDLKDFEPLDDLTKVFHRRSDIEDEVVTKETVALLAKDDRRKHILLAWKIGNTNNTEISRTLARSFGGNSDTHRKFIQRFENECRDRLAAVI